MAQLADICRGKQTQLLMLRGGAQGSWRLQSMLHKRPRLKRAMPEPSSPRTKLIWRASVMPTMPWKLPTHVWRAKRNSVHHLVRCCGALALLDGAGQ